MTVTIGCDYCADGSPRVCGGCGYFEGFPEGTPRSHDEYWSKLMIRDEPHPYRAAHKIADPEGIEGDRGRAVLSRVTAALRAIRHDSSHPDREPIDLQIWWVKDRGRPEERRAERCLHCGAVLVDGQPLSTVSRPGGWSKYRYKTLDSEWW